MAWDLAIEYNTGDLIYGPGNDLQARVGSDTIDQRVRVQLRIPQGEWALDPSGGALGSRVNEVLRMPMPRALQELELVVREALSAMDDIEVDSVIVKSVPPNTVNIQVVYRPILTDEDELIEDAELMTTDLSITIPVE